MDNKTAVIGMALLVLAGIGLAIWLTETFGMVWGYGALGLYLIVLMIGGDRFQ